MTVLHDEGQIIELLRSKIPIPGSDWTYLWRLTVLPGSKVDPHQHTGWTACYYQDVGQGGAVWRGNEKLHPENGDVILFPPKVRHWVEENTGSTPRKSFALTVNLGDNRQTRKDVIR